jgi:inosine-uridine nucleoside N-ribohydrolase
MDHRIPVILDTDIGGDIDDTWALAMLLRSPELDLKLVVTDTGDTWYRAMVAAKLLEVAGRTDVPVGIGVPQGGDAAHVNLQGQPQGPWVEGYDLARYPGELHQDGVGALIATIMNSPEPVTLIAIGPVPNLAEALRREPRIAERVGRVIGMHGSVRLGYGGSSVVNAEYNVAADVPSCRAMFEAAWPLTLTPLDTCGLVTLKGEKLARVRESTTPLARAVVENNDIWAERINWVSIDSHVETSVLFDTVAIYLAFSEELVEMEELPLRVTDDGFTVVDEAEGRRVRCAMRWKDLSGFEDLLVERLVG